MAYTIVCDSVEEESKIIKREEAAKEELVSSQKSRIRINLDSNSERRLEALTKLFRALPSSVRAAEEGTALPLRDTENREKIAPSKETLLPPKQSNYSGAPPYLDKISAELVAWFSEQRAIELEARKEKLYQRNASRSRSPNYGPYPRGRARSNQKIYELEKPIPIPTDTLSIVTRIVEATPKNELEGRSLATVANQLLNSNRQLSHLRQDSSSLAEIEKNLLQLAARGYFKLSKDGTRFGLIKPDFVHIFLIPPLPDELVTQIWKLHSSTLLKATSFKSALNILLNSCSQLHIFALDERVKVAEWLLCRYLEEELLR